MEMNNITIKKVKEAELDKIQENVDKEVKKEEVAKESTEIEKSEAITEQYFTELEEAEPEEEEQDHELVHDIQMMFKLHSKVLEEYKPEIKKIYTLDNKALKELSDKYNDIITIHNGRVISKKIITISGGLLEYGAPFVGLNLKGLTASIMEDDEIDGVVNELLRKYKFTKYVEEPEYRLALLLGLKCYQVHNQNRVTEAVSKKLEEKTTIPEEFKDL
jgi:hypothetical protein